ncbi:MAG: hypothetical protein ACKO40_14565 [Planctomycetaceae bacterium]
MNATSHRHAAPSLPGTRQILETRIAGETCTVRATTVWPIAEVLDFERQFDDVGMLQGDAADADLVIDALESQMIAPPRPGRRQRTVSSRALFYAGG